MKILHILDHSIPLQSGYTFRTRNILRYQRELGWKTAHVTGMKHVGAAAQEEDVDGLHFYRTLNGSRTLPKIPIANQWHVVHTLSKRIEQVIQKEKPDILHAHSPALNGLAALQANKKFGLPVVYECRAFWEDAAVDHGTSTEHGLRYKLTRSLETRVFRNVDAVTTICEGLRHDIVERGISEQKVTVIPNAVDVEHFTFGTGADVKLKEMLGLVNKTVIGFIGSFYAYEGIPFLLDALPAMIKANPNMKLLLVGGGPQDQIIREKVQQLKLQDYVVMTGRVPHSEVQSYYNLVDVFVYPRLHMRLTDLVTPLKPLEAMAQGKVVVASDVGGHQELIKDGVNGFLFSANSADSLAKKIITVINEEDQWKKIREQGRAYVEQDRNWQNSVKRYEPLYHNIWANQCD